MCNAHAVTVWLADDALRNQDWYNIQIGYQKVAGNGCSESNMTHNVRIEKARFGYDFSTPFPTAATANEKICLITQCTKGGVVCPGGNFKIYESLAVKNVPECTIKIINNEDNRFEYTTECGV